MMNGVCLVGWHCGQFDNLVFEYVKCHSCLNGTGCLLVYCVGYWCLKQSSGATCTGPCQQANLPHIFRKRELTKEATILYIQFGKAFSVLLVFLLQFAIVSQRNRM